MTKGEGDVVSGFKNKFQSVAASVRTFDRAEQNAAP
jgi:hypothetical protein